MVSAIRTAGNSGARARVGEKSPRGRGSSRNRDGRHVVRGLARGTRTRHRSCGVLGTRSRRWALHRPAHRAAVLRRRKDHSGGSATRRTPDRLRQSDLLQRQHHGLAVALEGERTGGGESRSKVIAHRARARLGSAKLVAGERRTRAAGAASPFQRDASFRAVATTTYPRTRIAQVNLTMLRNTFGTRFIRLIVGGRFSITRVGISITRSASR